jgi:8-oxo-dGTP pyrophosphatase MutT (NUDIX family)
MPRSFLPSVTVAAVIVSGERYLLVEEETKDGLRYNQPAGHLEAGESLADAVLREAREETAYHFTPTGLLGIYLSRSQSSFNDDMPTYLRFAFVGELGKLDPSQKLDDGIVRALWLSYREIEALEPRHRSPMVMQCVRDHRRGKAVTPLDVFFNHDSALAPLPS